MLNKFILGVLALLLLLPLSYSSVATAAQNNGAAAVAEIERLLDIIDGITDRRPDRDSRDRWDRDRGNRDDWSRRPIRRPGYGRNIQCTATDTGWEEHWGGHSSCRECLKEHGNCVERCSEVYHSCEVTGRDRSGYTRTFYGIGSAEWEARDEATDRCYRSGFDSCSRALCRKESEQISSQRCRRR